MSKQQFQLRTPVEESLHKFAEARKTKQAKKKCQAELPDDRKYGTRRRYERSEEQIEAAKSLAERAFQN